MNRAKKKRGGRMATGARIAVVREGSIAEEMDLNPGDTILSINGQIITDLIDYRNLMADEYVEVEVQKQDGELWVLEVDKDYEEDLGAEFEQATFDDIRRCRNKCVFCFVDQMPDGMRPSLYIKDDDYRMSLLHGNFVTLTNLSDEDLQRIIEQKLSPLYISVHTTNPELRKKLLNNRFAGRIYQQVQQLAKAGISMHTQIVTCPGLNDGSELERTVRELSDLAPAVLSIAIVPVGLTDFRQSLYPLRTFTKAEANEIVEHVQQWQKQFRERYDANLVYLSDEFYLIAERDFPGQDSYDDFCQLENGVGLSRLFLDSFAAAKGQLPNSFASPLAITCVTGVSGAKVLQQIKPELDLIHNLQFDILTIDNDFFGNRVTVTGLLTGADILARLKTVTKGCLILLPAVVFREGSETLLDGMTLAELRTKSGHIIDVVAVDDGAEDLIQSIKRCEIRE